MTNKTIDLKEEEATARSNLEKYAFIKSQIISTLLSTPGVNQEALLETLCNYNSLSKGDFIFINNLERQAIQEQLNYHMRKK